MLLVASVGALSAVFVCEMLLGRFVSDGADQAAAVALFQTFQSGAVLGALMPGLLAFFIGTALFVTPLASTTGPFRWPALCFALGAILILSGLGVMTGNVIARTVGVLVAALSMVANFAFIPWYPLWSIAVIAVDIAVIWALTAHGRDVIAE